MSAVHPRLVTLVPTELLIRRPELKISLEETEKREELLTRVRNIIQSRSGNEEKINALQDLLLIQQKKEAWPELAADSTEPASTRLPPTDTIEGKEAAATATIEGKEAADRTSSAAAAAAAPSQQWHHLTRCALLLSVDPTDFVKNLNGVRHEFDKTS
jgi:hypothetical protein